MLTFVAAILHFLRTLKELVQDPEFKGLLGVVAITLLVGTVFYSGVEKWSLLDSLYFSTTTLATVGFGDLYPKTDLGKAFTIVYILTGVGLILAFVNSLAHHTRKENPIVKILNGMETKKHES
jgi:voltage-gated potassium channel